MDRKRIKFTRAGLWATFSACLLVAGAALAATSVSWSIGINQSTATLTVDDGSKGLAFRAVTAGDTAMIDARAAYGGPQWEVTGQYTCADNVTRSFHVESSGLGDRILQCDFGLTVKKFEGVLSLKN